MKVYRQIGSLPAIKNPVVTIGTFDGVHKAHQKIISRIKGFAAEIDGESVIVTFHPHPRLVINPDADVAMLSTLEEKLQLLEQNGVDHTLVVPFNREFSEITAESYIHDFLIGSLQPKVIVIGYDHRFGLNRTGDISLLKSIAAEHSIRVQEIHKQSIDEVTISSTMVRTALQEGKVKLAAQFSGYSYRLTGIVIKGFQIGRELGYPTANLLVEDQHKLVPADGIYAVRVHTGETVFGGMLSIGFRPTFDGTQRTIEVNIFDFDKEIYGERLTLEFIGYIRSELKFDGRDDLIAAMAADKVASLAMLAEADSPA